MLEPLARQCSLSASLLASAAAAVAAAAATAAAAAAPPRGSSRCTSPFAQYAAYPFEEPLPPLKPRRGGPSLGAWLAAGWLAALLLAPAVAPLLAGVGAGGDGHGGTALAAPSAAWPRPLEPQLQGPRDMQLAQAWVLEEGGAAAGARVCASRGLGEYPPSWGAAGDAQAAPLWCDAAAAAGGRGWPRPAAALPGSCPRHAAAAAAAAA